MADLELQEHGGYCCGINHLMSFPYNEDYKGNKWVDISWDDETLTPKELEFEVRRLVHDSDGGAVEVVLTQEQTKCIPTLRRVGFKKVFEFRNPNSKNICNVFYIDKTKVKEEKKKK